MKSIVVTSHGTGKKIRIYTAHIIAVYEAGNNGTRIDCVGTPGSYQVKEDIGEVGKLLD